VVNEFLDVFPEELLGMPLDRDIEFVIELVLGIAPVYQRPYRMTSKQLVEHKEQIKELLEKGYIHPIITMGSTGDLHSGERWHPKDVCGLLYSE
jgi:hypothetical protein